jgi:superfamily II DNA/RNA helicase
LIYSLVIFYLLNNLGKGKKFLLVVPSKTLVTQFYDDIINFCQDKLYLNIKEIFGEEEKPRTRFIDEEPNLYIGTFQSLADKDKYPKKYFKQF